MSSHDAVEAVVPTQIVKGDVIHDPVGDRWLTVTEICTLSDVGSGAYSFYGDGPDDRVTFQGGELVSRRPWMGRTRRQTLNPEETRTVLSLPHAVPGGKGTAGPGAGC